MSKEKSKYLCVGIDGCKGKWVAVALSENSFYKAGKIINKSLICLYCLYIGY